MCQSILRRRAARSMGSVSSASRWASRYAHAVSSPAEGPSDAAPNSSTRSSLLALSEVDMMRGRRSRKSAMTSRQEINNQLSQREGEGGRTGNGKRGTGGRKKAAEAGEISVKPKKK